MSTMRYDPLPTSSQPSYPPVPSHSTHLSPLPGPPYPFRPPRASWSPRSILKYTFGTLASLITVHFALLGAFPSSPLTIKYRQTFPASSTYGAYASNWFSSVKDTEYSKAASKSVDGVLETLASDLSASQGAFLRDSFPIRTALALWELAEREVQARGLDTCGDQLGRGLIEAYHRSELALCLPKGTDGDAGLQLVEVAHLQHGVGSGGQEAADFPGTEIFCTPVHYDMFSKWWPYPAAPCFSTNLRTISNNGKEFHAMCDYTHKGVELKAGMGKERFLGADITRVANGSMGAECKQKVGHTVMVIGRQDQWNPFHVAEDLITTLVTMFIAARTAPQLIEQRIQLVFVDGFGMDGNHFTPLWDRMGAWAPRRLSLDPWAEGECLTNAIHSVGAGASLLSAMGIGRSYSCASTITWAASHYYRHLFGLVPPSMSSPDILLESFHPSARPRRPINVLWLSRAKLDHYAQEHSDWSNWRDVRHIENEAELVQRLRSGLRSMCEDSTAPDFGPDGCEFEDAQDIPDTWALSSPATIAEGDPLPVRFAMIDPTVHALETQVHFVGHTTILIASHGGALGLSLFLPPGDGVVIELQVHTVVGNFHFEHLANEMGHQYTSLKISKKVNVQQVWESVEGWVRTLALSG